jgi:hypothetical protein
MQILGEDGERIQLVETEFGPKHMPRDITASLGRYWTYRA